MGDNLETFIIIFTPIFIVVSLLFSFFSSWALKNYADHADNPRRMGKDGSGKSGHENRN